MKKIIAALSALTLLLVGAAAQTFPPLLPKPVEVTVGSGTVPFSEPAVTLGSKDFRKRTASLPAFARDAAYRLSVTPKGIRIEANTPSGEFYARQTLAQLSRDPQAVPCCTVTDYPRFAYRGIMLDISRHFRDKEFIFKQIDAMAEVKLNRLHLHLTDDAGWRIEIKAYPRLTNYAAWRKGATWKEWNSTGKRYAHEGEEGAFGGYLTQDDAREIVAYAAARNITVIPEIEMPGHSAEVIAAFPELSCLTEDGESFARNTSDFCPGREETFTFLETVLREVMDIFPSTYIHVGGDEAGKRNWRSCPLCHARMEQEHLDGVNELQSYLIERIERFLNDNGRSLLGWDEILEGGLAPNATVMSWRGTEGGIKAATMGHDVVMTPGNWCYLDKYQDAQFKEPEAIGGYLPLWKVYSYDPLTGIPADAQHHMLGVQGNLWHEFIPTPEHTEYMLWPRAFGIAEVGWTLLENKDEADFLARAAYYNEQLKQRGYHPFDQESFFGERKVYDNPPQHIAVGCPVIYNGKRWERQYPGVGEGTLTDGKMGSWGYADERWQGFLADVDVTVDLGSVRPVHYVGATFMQQTNPQIFLPTHVEISISDNGTDFTPIGEVWNETPADVPVVYTVFGTAVNATGRYVRYRAERNKDWLFVDEIVIN